MPGLLSVVLLLLPLLSTPLPHVPPLPTLLPPLLTVLLMVMGLLGALPVRIVLALAEQIVLVRTTDLLSQIMAWTAMVVRSEHVLVRMEPLRALGVEGVELWQARGSWLDQEGLLEALDDALRDAGPALRGPRHHRLYRCFLLYPWWSSPSSLVTMLPSLFVIYHELARRSTSLPRWREPRRAGRLSPVGAWGEGVGGARGMSAPAVVDAALPSLVSPTPHPPSSTQASRPARLKRDTHSRKRN